jgi:hypothetical protein
VGGVVGTTIITSRRLRGERRRCFHFRMEAFQHPTRREAILQAGAGAATVSRERRRFVDGDVSEQPPVAGQPGKLLPHEGAFVLQVSLRTVRNMMRRRALRDVGCDRWRRLDPEELAEKVSDRPLALAALAAILEGRLRLDRPELDDSPVSLMERWESLW